VRCITVGAILTVGLVLGSSVSQANAAIAPTPLVTPYAGFQPTVDDSAIIVEETGEPTMTIDPIESSGVVLGNSL
jgi:hypothetical protein